MHSHPKTPASALIRSLALPRLVLLGVEVVTHIVITFAVDSVEENAFGGCQILLLRRVVAFNDFYIYIYI